MLIFEEVCGIVTRNFQYFDTRMRAYEKDDSLLEKRKMKEVDVVVGIILKGNRFLVERRRSDEKIDPGIVCLPGGHVNPGESREGALRREMREELGIEVKECKFVCKNLYIASNKERQNTHCFLVTNYVGRPVCRSAQEIFWENNTGNLSLEVDRDTIRKLKEMLASKE